MMDPNTTESSSATAINPERAVPLIWFGIFAKVGVVLICLLDVVTGLISWQILMVAVVDAVYPVLFWQTLRSIRLGMP